MLRVGICGVCGKMGKKIASLAVADPKINLCAALERPDSPDVGKDIGPLIGVDEIGVKVTSKLEEACDRIDCFIDFTLPESTVNNAEMYSSRGISLVIGTTGLSGEAEEKVREAAKTIPIVFAPNMSAGVNVFFKLIEDAAKILCPEFNVKIDETHHVHKKDSPSGTAKKIGQILSEISGVYPMIEAFREGEVVGNHGVIFESKYETIEIRHDAKSRDVFAAGAIKAAKFLSGKAPGLYSMFDVLGISSE